MFINTLSCGNRFRPIKKNKELYEFIKNIIANTEITPEIYARAVVWAQEEGHDMEFYNILTDICGYKLIENGEALLSIFDEEYGYGSDEGADAVECLIQDGANIHVFNERPLLRSVINGDCAIAETLLRHGANVNVEINPNVEIKAGYIHGGSLLSDYRNKGKIYPMCDILTWIVWTGYWKHNDWHIVNLTRVLLEHGANVHAFNDMPLREAATTGFWRSGNVVRQLVEAGADVNVLEPEQRAWVEEVCAEGSKPWDEYSYRNRR